MARANLAARGFRLTNIQTGGFVNCATPAKTAEPFRDAVCDKNCPRCQEFVHLTFGDLHLRARLVKAALLARRCWQCDQSMRLNTHDAMNITGP